MELVGHENPIGLYPGAVVPVMKDGNSFYRVFADQNGNAISEEPFVGDYTTHSPKLSMELSSFDPKKNRLFAHSENELAVYNIEDEALFFSNLLANEFFSLANPFLRLSLSKGTGSLEAVAAEISNCLAWIISRERAKEIDNGVTKRFLEEWYEDQVKEVSDLITNGGLSETVYLPADLGEMLLSPWYQTKFIKEHSHYVYPADFEGKIGNLEAVIVANRKPAIASGDLRVGMKRQIAKSRTRYIFLVPNNIYEDDYETLSKELVLIAQEAIDEFNLVDPITEIKKSCDDIFSIYKLSYEGPKFPHIFYDTRDNTGKKIILGLRGNQPGTGMSDKYIPIPKIDATELLAALKSDKPELESLPDINIAQYTDNPSALVREESIEPATKLH